MYKTGSDLVFFGQPGCAQFEALYGKGIAAVLLPMTYRAGVQQYPTKFDVTSLDAIVDYGARPDVRV